MRRSVKWIAGAWWRSGWRRPDLFAWFVCWPVHTMPALEPVIEYVWLDQGWGTGQNAALRQRYYYTAAGHLRAAGRFRRRRCVTTGS